MKRILIVDSDMAVRSQIGRYARLEGYEVAEAGDGYTAVALCRQNAFDFVILAILLPELDGFSVCQTIRSFSQVPILILSECGDESDRIRGLELGADDYMVKPFGVLELSARIRSLLRRTRREPEEDVLCFEKIRVNRQTREVFSAGRQVELTLKEFELLVYLMENQTRVVTRDELLNQIWGYEYDGETRTLDMHIRTLRQKLGEEGGACIRTVRGVGYRMVRPEA